MRILTQIISSVGKNTYMLPGRNIKPLCVQYHNGNVVMYYESDATADEIIDRQLTTPTTIDVLATGSERNDLVGFDYLGSVTMPYGIVWHCYVRQELSYDL